MGKRGSIAVLLLCEVGAMAVWFASAVVAALIRRDAGDAPGTAWLTAAVQAGFVLGTAGSAALSLADRFDPRRLFAASALAAAAATAALAALPPTGPAPVLLRLLTGMCMAGVYPVGMRLAATWARTGPGGDLGLLVGLLVGALTLGSASPHLLGAVPGLDWRGVYLASAAVAAACGLGIGLCGLGPNHARAARVDLRRMAQAWRSRPLRLANLGYLGHMWELYAMWAWLGPFLLSSFDAAGVAQPGARAEAAAFAAIAVGAAGAWGGGALADRVGAHARDGGRHAGQRRLRAGHRLAARRRPGAGGRGGAGVGRGGDRGQRAVLGRRGGACRPGLGRDVADVADLPGVCADPGQHRAGAGGGGLGGVGGRVHDAGGRAVAGRGGDAAAAGGCGSGAAGGGTGLGGICVRFCRNAGA